MFTPLDDQLNAHLEQCIADDEADAMIDAVSKEMAVNFLTDECNCPESAEIMSEIMSEICSTADFLVKLRAVFSKFTEKEQGDEVFIAAMESLIGYCIESAIQFFEDDALLYLISESKNESL